MRALVGTAAGKLLIAAAGVLLVAAVVVVLLLLRPGQPAPATSFPPWYPMVSAEGDPVFADFENHTPCALDPQPAAECQRVKFAIALYRDPVTEEPTSYLIQLVRVGSGDDVETH